MPGKLFYQLHLLIYVRAISISKGKILGAHKVQGFAVWKEPYSRVNIVQPSRYPTEVLVVRVVPLYSLPGTVRRSEKEAPMSGASTKAWKQWQDRGGRDLRAG